MLTQFVQCSPCPAYTHTILPLLLILGQEASGSTTLPPTAQEAATWDLQQRKEAPLLSTCCFKQPAAAGAAEVVDGGPPTIDKLSGAFGTTTHLRNNVQHYDQGGDASKAALLEGAGLVPDRTMRSFIM